MNKDLTYEQVLELVRAEFEPLAINMLADIKAAAGYELEKPLLDTIILKLCEAFVAGIETGGEKTEDIINRHKER